MRKFRKITGYSLILFLLSGIHNGSAQTLTTSDSGQISFSDLLQEMLNRGSLAEFPENWTLHHVSSYDRRSVLKDKEGWYANEDWDHYIRKENNHGREEYVLLDAAGPGAITRFWAGGHPNKKAHLRFYIDGQVEPFWEADHTGALIGQNVLIGVPLSQRSVDMDYLPINQGAQPGHNLYAPIPFRKHIKVTYDKAPGGADNGFWYNIDYRIYTSKSAVESFSAHTTGKYAGILQKTNAALTDFMAESPASATVPGEKKISPLSFELAPMSSKEIGLKGPGSLRRIVLSLNPNGDDSVTKNIWLQISFDGRETVHVPAGFFFGCGDQLIHTRDWYAKVDSNGVMASYWVMPYRHSARVRVINSSSSTVSGSLKVATGDWHWNDRSMYFHAGFKRMNQFMTEAQKGEDFNYLDLKQKSGLYVGDMLQVSKNVGGWWGEGDEKIYIDGSSFPDDFGTGSEDYYGYSWGHPETFNHIFNAQPIGNANLTDRGGTTVNIRQRNLDAVPFSKSFHFDMESWNWFGGPVNYSLICFWYEKPLR
ncbi:MAG: glycoside hydrolase family 172 protein [Chitinophagales bacterium]